MSARIRINVKFGDTKVLVPVGEGNITVEELIAKAIEKYRKFMKLHEEDRIVVNNIRQEDNNLGEGGSYIDRDDDVVDVLDDKDSVVLEYQLIRHNSDGSTEVYDPTDRPSPSSSVHLPSLHRDTLINDHYYAPSSSNYHISSPRPSSTTLSEQLHPPYSEFNHTTPSPLQHLSSNGRLAEESKSSERALSEISFEEVHPSQGGLSQVQDESHLIFQEQPTGDHHQSQVAMTPLDNNGPSSQKHTEEDTYAMHSPQPPSSTPVVSTSAGERPVTNGGANPMYPTMYSNGGMDLNNYHRDQPHSAMSNYKPYPPPSRSLSMEYLHNNEPPLMHGPLYDPGFSPGHGAYHSHVMMGPGHDGYGYPPHHQFYPPHADPYLPPSSASSIKSTASSHFFPGDMQQQQRPRPGPMSSHSLPGGNSANRYTPHSMQNLHNTLPTTSMEYMKHGYDFGEQMYHNIIHQHSSGEHPALRWNRRKSGDFTGHDDPASRGRGYGRAPQRQWRQFEDDRVSQTQRGGGGYDDLDYRLSQPVSMLPPPPHNQYGGSNYPMRGGRRGGIRMGGGMAGLSLSQPDTAMRPRPFNTPPKSVLKNRKEQSPRGDMWRPPTYSGDKFEEADEEQGRLDDHEAASDEEPSPFQRNARKSMFRDSSVYGYWQEKYENMDDYEGGGEIPEYGGSQSQSQPTSSPALSGEENEDDLHENIRVVVLEREHQPLGIHLVSYTSNGKDLGVYIAAIDKNGFAAQDGQLQVSDKILACNGEDFTDEDNAVVEQLFKEMASSEPVLKIAVSRGGQTLDLVETTDSHLEDWEQETDDPEADRHGSAAVSEEASSSSPLPPSAGGPLPTSVTNTRHIGVRHQIELQRGDRGLGFGLASRDVTTNDRDQPIYVKFIHSEGPAFQDGRLKLGDRILEVNGVSVKGKSQAEVVVLLKSSDRVSLVVSRQEVVDSQDEFPDSAEPSAVTSVDKSILTFSIPLNSCGMDGLGVKVHGRCSNARHQSGDMGIFIKFIEPNGAAARHGQLKKNDQLLSVNGQSLLNLSNRDALDALKKALSDATITSQDSVIQLTIARTAGINRKTSLTMSSYSSQMAALQEEEERQAEVDIDGQQQDKEPPPREVGIDCPPEKKSSEEVRHQVTLRHSRVSESPHDHRSTHPLSPSHVTSSYHHKPKETSPRPSSAGERGSTRRSDHTSSEVQRHSYYEPSSRVKEERRRDYPESRERAIDVGAAQRHSSLSPTTEWATTVFDQDSHSSSLDRRDVPHGYPRSTSMHSDISSFSQTTVSSSLSRGLRDSFRRAASPPYDTLEKGHSSASSTSSSAHSRSHPAPPPLIQSSEQQHSPRVIGDSNTLPRARGRRDSSGTAQETASLNSYNSESDLMNPFQRDDVNRRSIPKNKRNLPPRDFSHLRYAKFENMEPQLEDDRGLSSPLYRTGSDGDLSAIASSSYSEAAAMMASVPVGPNLRLAKSSSLESLQTVMHYTIRAADVDGEPSMLRNRTTRSSFHRAVDRSLDTGNGKSRAGSSALISHTKSPGKKKSRKGFLHWIKKKRGKKDKSTDRKTRAGSTADFDFSEESIEQLARQFGISETKIRQMGTHSGKIDGPAAVTTATEQDYEDDQDQEEDESSDDDSIIQTRSQV